MVLELESGTDAGCHALFDPEALSHLTIMDRETADERLIEQEAEQGNILINDTAGDGGDSYRVYVNEDVPRDLLPRARHAVKDLLLRIPSGTLIASGIEYVNDEAKVNDSKSFDPETEALVTRASIPPGNYHVDAYEMDWDWDRDIYPALRDELGIRAWIDSRVMPIGCLASIAGLVLLIINMVAVIRGRSAVLGWWTWVLAAGLVMLPLLLIGLMGRNYRIWKRRIQMRYSPNILHFRRLPDDADLSQVKGGAFGIGIR